MEMEKVGLKETKEVLDAAKGLVLDSLKAAEDGLSLDDLNVLFKNLEPLKNAIQGADQIGAEFKDLDVEEIKELVSCGVDLVFSVIAGVKALSDAKKKAEA